MCIGRLTVTNKILNLIENSPLQTVVQISDVPYNSDFIVALAGKLLKRRSTLVV